MHATKDPSMSPRLPRYMMFGLVYFAEGAILSYFTALNALYLLRYQVSLSQIGLMGTIALIPFVIKIFLGMLSDRVNLFGLGHRKPYILIGILVQAVCLLIVPLINPASHFWLFALLGFILMMGQALYDTCTDGLALDTTQPTEEGAVQGIMVGGRALGVVLISATIGLIAENASWAAAFITLAALTLLPLPFVLRVPEPERRPGQRFTWSAFSAFKTGPVIALGLLGALYSLVINGANQIVNPFLQRDFNISISTAGFITTAWGIGVVIGGLSGGRLIDSLGRRKAVLVVIFLCLAAVSSLAFLWTAAAAWPLVILFGLAFGYYETLYFAVSMQTTDSRIAASMFAILMAVANLGTGIGLALSGALSDWLGGFRPVFIIFAALNMLALPLLPRIFTTISPSAEISTSAD
jgi:PAT family beta-lactamase induction signal transducer AmpG